MSRYNFVRVPIRGTTGIMSRELEESRELVAQLEAEAESANMSKDRYIYEIIQNRHVDREATESIREFREQLEERENRIRELETKLESGSETEAELQNLRERLETRSEQVESDKNELTAHIEENEELKEELSTLKDRLETREQRIDQLEAQLAKRSQIEDNVEELSMVVHEDHNQINAPFFVRWWRWIRS